MGLTQWLYFRDLKRRVAKQGWTTVHVEEGGVDPAYSYTVALGAAWNIPELVAFGLPPDIAQQVLEHAAERLRTGELKAEDGAIWDVGPDDVRYVLRQVHPTHFQTEHFGSALWWCAQTKTLDSFNPFQVVGLDRNGRLPWEPGCTFGSRMTQKPLYEPLDEADPERWYLAIEEEWRAAGEPEMTSPSCG